MEHHTASDPNLRARQFAYRVKSAEVVSALLDAGIRPVLLKGLAFERLLYPDADRRLSTDLDLMIPPSGRDTAGAALRAIGYESTFLREDDAIRRTVHADTWHRESDSSWVDIHLTLPEAACGPEASWRALSAHLVPFEIRGLPALALDRCASGLLAAVHAAHHGPVAGPETSEDLRRAVRLLDLDEWRSAADLAACVGSLDAFGQGLATLPEGERLARRLGSRTELSVRRRLLWADAPWGAVVLEEMSQLSARRRLLVAARLLLPAPRALRARSRLARHGAVGLALAYLLRPLALMGKMPSALLAWRNTRRVAEHCMDLSHPLPYDGASRKDVAASKK